MAHHAGPRRRHQPPPRHRAQPGPPPGPGPGPGLRRAGLAEAGPRPPRHPQPRQAGPAVAVRGGAMALALDRRAVRRGMAAYLAIAAPCGLLIALLHGSDHPGHESGLWVVAAVVIIVVRPLRRGRGRGGGPALAARPRRPGGGAPVRRVPRRPVARRRGPGQPDRRPGGHLRLVLGGLHRLGHAGRVHGLSPPPASGLAGPGAGGAAARRGQTGKGGKAISILVIDVGTSGVRASIVRPDGTVEHIQHRPTLPSTPSPGFVEFDAAAMADAALDRGPPGAGRRRPGGRRSASPTSGPRPSCGTGPRANRSGRASAGRTCGPSGPA